MRSFEKVENPELLLQADEDASQVMRPASSGNVRSLRSIDTGLSTSAFIG